MRITSGLWGGRRLAVPDGIRPTQDMVRQAVFSALGERVPGARVLDLFAGSGAMGFEALSRGAASVTAVESNSGVLRAVRQNAAALAVESEVHQVVPADAVAFLRRAAGTPWDLVFADPPYDKDGKARWLDQVLAAMLEAPVLAPGGVLVFEQGADEPEAARSGCNCFWTRRYGGTRVGLWTLTP